MSDWTDFDLNVFLPGEPLTSAKALAWYENPIAIAEGAPGAPRNLLRSLERITPGTEIRSRNDTAVGTDDATVTGHSFAFTQIGEVRVSFTLSGIVGAVSGQVQRFRNGTSTTLATQTSNGTYTVDVEILPGDVVSVVIVRSSFTDGTLSNCRFQTNGENLWPGNGARLENDYA